MGSLGDRFGRKRPLYVGLVLFLIGSVVLAFAGWRALFWGLFLLGLAGVCSIGASQFSPNAMKRWGPERLPKTTTAIGMLVALLLAFLELSNMLPLVLLQAVLMVMFVVLGFTLTPGAVTALDSIQAAVPLTIVLACVWTLASVLARVAFLGPKHQPA